MSDQDDRGGLDELTVDQLQAVARNLEIDGRSKMDKAELIDAIELNRRNNDLPVSGVLPSPMQSVAVNDDGYVHADEYRRVLNENHQLRVQLQQAVQGAVGAPQPGAPDPGHST